MESKMNLLHYTLPVYVYWSVLKPKAFINRKKVCLQRLTFFSFIF